MSGTIPTDLTDQIAAGRRPRADYVEMAEAFGADLLDYGKAEATQGRVGRLVQRAAGRDAALALRCFALRRRYDVIFTDGEQIGLPLAILTALLPRRRRPRHMMIVHIMSVPKKSRLFTTLRLGRGIDEMVVYSTAQQRFIVDRLQYPADQVTLVPFMVDTEFFRATERPDEEPPVVSSAGLELRDYPTMLAAVDGLEARVIVAAASPWSKRRSELDEMPLPANVEVVRLDLHQLRELYDRSSIVVMPLRETDFQAGVTTLLEAMAMGRAIVCTRTAGQTDVITDGDTGVYVPPADPAAMREAIATLLTDAERRAELGRAARAWVERTADVDVYVELLRHRVERQLAMR